MTRYKWTHFWAAITPNKLKQSCGTDQNSLFLGFVLTQVQGTIATLILGQMFYPDFTTIVELLPSSTHKTSHSPNYKVWGEVEIGNTDLCYPRLCLNILYGEF